MSWQIESFRSVGPVSFGQSRDDIRSELGSDFQTFKKAEGENDTDAYDSLGLHIYYDDHDHVEFIEAFSPAELSFEGVSLVGQKVVEIVSQLNARGYDGQQDDVGYNYDNIGIGLTINGDEIEGVGIFRKGYYD